MTAITTAELKIQNAKNFLRSIAAAEASKDFICAAIGRGAPWGLGNDSNGVEIVPAPTDKLSEELLTRAAFYGIKRISDADVSHVVPRIDWTSGVTYTAYNNATLVNTLFASQFYVLTVDFNIYKCIVSPGTASTVKPTGTSTSNLVTGDGYTWKYMATVSTGDSLKWLTVDWMPIATGARRSSAQIAAEAAASYSAGQPLYGHGASAIEELYAFYLMANLTFVGSESGTLPTNDDFRQIALLMNPSLKDSNGNFATGNNYAAANFNLNTGRMIYIENRAPIVRSSSQTETAKVIIQF